MSFKRKYLNPVILYLLVYIFGFVFLSVGTMLARYAYAYMNYLFPKIFPIFSAVSEKESYEKYLTLLGSMGILISIWLINYFALRLDNAKFELMINRTDGQYTLAEGLPIFIREFGVSELIAAMLLPAILCIPPYFIPDFGVQSVPVVGFLILLLENLLWLGYACREHFSLFHGVLLVIIFSLVSRASLIPGALKKWRASWLSGAIE